MSIIPALSESPLVMDTDVFSHLRNDQDYVKKALTAYFAATKQLPAITANTVFEAFHGVEQQIVNKKITEAEADVYITKIESLINQHQILPFDHRAAQIAAYVLPRLRKDERNKHFQDVMIIATALAHNFGLATGNKKDVDLIAKNLPSENGTLRFVVWKP